MFFLTKFSAAAAGELVLQMNSSSTSKGSVTKLASVILKNAP
jgi:hypothetical protein